MTNELDLITTPEVRRRLGGISDTTLNNWRRDRGFPQPVRLSQRTIAWRARDVARWVERADTQTRAKLHHHEEILNVR